MLPTRRARRFFRHRFFLFCRAFLDLMPAFSYHKLYDHENVPPSQPLAIFAADSNPINVLGGRQNVPQNRAYVPAGTFAQATKMERQGASTRRPQACARQADASVAP